MAGQGWVRVDPTSAVAPARTGSLARLEPRPGIFAQALGSVSPAFALNLRAVWEAANNRWNQWVLNYSQARQLDLLRRIGFESPSWEDLGYVLSAIVVLAALLGAAWTLWERRQHDPWLRLLHRASEKLQRGGLKFPPNAAPRQLAALLQAQKPPTPSAAHTAALVAWLLRLEAWRYGAHTSNQGVTLGTLQREFRRLPWP